MSDSKFQQMIMELNQAYAYLIQAQNILKKYSRINPTIEVAYWKLSKAFLFYNSEMKKYLDKVIVDEQFKKIMEKFDEK